MQNPNQFLIYQSEDGSTRIDVTLEAETLWLNQKQLTELFGKAKGTISEHIRHIFEDGELTPAATVRLFRTVQIEGGREVAREVEHYNLDMILALGFRVRSPVGVRFRQWANDKLKEYIIKGFVLDDARLKNPGKGRDYFDELTRRLQDIRTSERRFYSENHRHLRHQRGLRRAPSAHSAVFRHGAKQGALRHPRPDRRRVDHQPRG
nr:RhuM family protein [Acidithiobacillus ferriphilus]